MVDSSVARVETGIDDGMISLVDCTSLENNDIDAWVLLGNSSGNYNLPL